VAAADVPIIANVTDINGTVTNGGTTFDRAVTVSGKASPNQKIRLRDGTISLGEPSADGNGEWRQTVSGLTVKAYSLTALALYGDGPVSTPPRTFTVAAHTAPTLTAVRDAASVEVPNNGQTRSTTVSLQGNVTPGHQVQIHDNNNPKHTVTASGNTWTTSLTVSLGGHTITAKAVTTGQFSNARSFTVISPILPLNFNTSPVTLSGKIYLMPDRLDILPAFGPGTSVQHQASGGQPGYSYTSSNTGVAAVDGAGHVTVRGRGTTTITARDTANQSKSYTVTVTGVIHCIGLGKNNWSGINQTASAHGARIPNMAELREIHAAYGARWPMGNLEYWSTDRANTIWPLYSNHCKNLVTGGEAPVGTYANGPHTLGVGLK
jgi:hypothetical protein